MNTNFRVVLDACVLANFSLCDLFLTLAEAPRLFLPMWNREILDEVQHTQVGKLDWPQELSRSWREAVEDSFPEAMVIGFESLLPSCANDPTHPLLPLVNCSVLESAIRKVLTRLHRIASPLDRRGVASIERRLKEEENDITAQLRIVDDRLNAWRQAK